MTLWTFQSATLQYCTQSCYRHAHHIDSFGQPPTSYKMGRNGRTPCFPFSLFPRGQSAVRHHRAVSKTSRRPTWPRPVTKKAGNVCCVMFIFGGLAVSGIVAAGRAHMPEGGGGAAGWDDARGLARSLQCQQARAARHLACQNDPLALIR